jgi:hypothetical protein
MKYKIHQIVEMKMANYIFQFYQANNNAFYHHYLEKQFL